MEVAKVEIYVRGIVVLIVILFDRHGTGIGRQSDAGDLRIVVGLDVHVAEWRVHLDVISVAVFAAGNPATVEEQAGSDGNETEADGVHEGTSAQSFDRSTP